MQVPSVTARREAAINIPAALAVWIGLMVAVHAARSLLPGETDLRLLVETAFVPAPWSIAFGHATPDTVLAAAEAGAKGGESAVRLALARFFVQEPPRLWSPLTYSVLHGSWGHLALNCLWLVAFGTSVVRRAGALRSAVLWLTASVGGAAAQWLSGPLGVDPMIGASAAVSGFMAAAATFVFQRPGEGRWGFLRNRGALTFVGVWLVSNLVFAAIAVPLGLADGEIAWQAHMGGLVVGLALYPFLDPFAGPPRRDAAFRSSDRDVTS